MDKLKLYIRTARYLRPKQAAFYVIRRLLPAIRRKCTPCQCQIRTGLGVSQPFLFKAASGGDYEFCFLNRSKTFVDRHIDWASADMSRLWRYNLQYFDYINDVGRSMESGGKLISDWIERNPPQSGDAWEPYPVSLRIVNWIKYFLKPEMANRVTDQWLDSLYKQALWLEQNIEYHILANHYLKNAKALYFAGTYFEGDDARRWHKMGLRILLEEADEQILADGGHYERSPMYHSIVLEDYLDVLNYMLCGGMKAERPVVDRLKNKVTAALEYLANICMPDGEIPLFNDSAFNIAHSPERLFGYARRVIGYEPRQLSDGISVFLESQSGYYAIRNNGDMIVIDCGIIGPDYQPGHAHCDTLSYELAINGRRVIVDSGVHDYERGRTRDYVRSTKAHNTVSVDGSEQSEIWGTFRVGRRAKPIAAFAYQVDRLAARFEGSHDGFKHLPGRVIHKRVVEYYAPEGWTIHDELSGAGHHEMEGFIHLHPDIKASVTKNEIMLTEACGAHIATIEVSDGMDITLQIGEYFPEFGLRIENVIISIKQTGVLPLQSQYRIRKAQSVRVTDADRIDHGYEL